MKVLCECNSFDCLEVINLSVEEVQRIKGLGGVIIVEGCKIGPEPTDTLISKEKGYSTYNEV